MNKLQIVAMGIGLVLFFGVAASLKYKYCEYMFGPEKAWACVLFTK